MVQKVKFWSTPELLSNIFFGVTMSPTQKKLFCQVLKGVKLPDGYAADIRHNVLINDKKDIWS
jgi:hypothetical protein